MRTLGKLLLNATFPHKPRVMGVRGINQPNTRKNKDMKPTIKNGTYEMNMAPYAGNLSETIGEFVNGYIGDMCDEYNLDYERWEVNFFDFFKAMSKRITYAIEDAFNDIADYIQVDMSTEEPSASNDLFTHPDYLPVDITVTDAEGLIKAWKEEFGADEIEDGYHISGFYRTYSDEQWSLHCILCDYAEANYLRLTEDIILDISEQCSEYVFTTEELAS